ncbi:MAG: serine/threonine protein kinase [Planctomycetota bacterium]|nr:serine/threonine protein kinase [Planctomycetota bacterium]
MSAATDFLQTAVEKGLLTETQANELHELRQARRKGGVAPAIQDLAIEKGFLTENQAQRLLAELEGFEFPREIGGYRLVEKIGAGTMGTVFRAKQLSLDRTVAIKILNPPLANRSEHVERFLREARAVAKLNHPNVISGIDVGESNGVRYFVMEYASGMTVGHLLQRGGAMDESRVARIALQIARALEHAHEARLVHRDIKPDNIMITKDGVAKLCDLGLAKDRPEEGGRALGTPDYISPEQAEGIEEVDIRADLYSFGATLYHMLTGQPPFEGAAKAVMVKHLSEEPTPIEELEDDVSTKLASIVSKLMRKHRMERYQTPSELVAALEAEGGPQGGPGAPVRRRTRRRRR